MEEWRYVTVFFFSTLDGGKCSKSRPGHFTSGERAASIHVKEDCVGTKRLLDAWVTKHSLAPEGRKTNLKRKGYKWHYAFMRHCAVYVY